MFRLNIHAGLPVVVTGAENPPGISNSPFRKGAHLDFLGAYGSGSFENIPHSGIFSCFYAACWYPAMLK